MRDRVLKAIPDVLALAGGGAVIYGLSQLASWLAWVIAGAALLVIEWLAAAGERRRAGRTP